MQKFYLFLRKLHRILVLIIMTLGLFMMLTGLLLKFSAFSAKNLGFINLSLVRFLHNNLSLYFSAALLVMIFSGAWMYFYPMWVERKHRKAKSESEQNREV